MSSSSGTNSNASYAPHPELLPTDDEDEARSNKLKECVENYTNVEAKHRVVFLLGVGLSVIDGFSIDSSQEDPFKGYKGKRISQLVRRITQSFSLKDHMQSFNRSKDCVILQRVEGLHL